MARTPSIFNNPLTGNLGQQTFKDYSGTQVVTSRFRSTSAKGSGASYAQRLVRLELPNIVLAGSQLKKYLPVLFENNKYYSTAYTHFISHNKNTMLPCQPKYDIESKYCHWGKLVVACGSLPFIPVRSSRYVVHTDIDLGEHLLMYNETVGWLSQKLIDANYGFLPGDYIFFISTLTDAHQRSSDQQWVYRTTPKFGYFMIDPTSSVVLNSVDTLGDIYLNTDMNTPGKFFFGVDVPDNGSAAIVHIRKIGNRYLSSPASMCLMSSAALYEQWAASDEWIDMCAASYGFKPDIL